MGGCFFAPEVGQRTHDPDPRRERAGERPRRKAAAVYCSWLRLHFLRAGVGGEGAELSVAARLRRSEEVLTRVISVERMAQKDDSATADQEGYDHAHERSSCSAIAAR
jgi:hypothetical protein